MPAVLGFYASERHMSQFGRILKSNASSLFSHTCLTLLLILLQRIDKGTTLIPFLRWQNTRHKSKWGGGWLTV